MKAPPYKYIVTCMIIQKTDKPLYSTYATYWENNTDGLKYVAYPNPK